MNLVNTQHIVLLVILCLFLFKVCVYIYHLEGGEIKE